MHTLEVLYCACTWVFRYRKCRILSAPTPFLCKLKTKIVSKVLKIFLSDNFDTISNNPIHESQTLFICNKITVQVNCTRKIIRKVYHFSWKVLLDGRIFSIPDLAFGHNETCHKVSTEWLNDLSLSNVARITSFTPGSWTIK